MGLVVLKLRRSSSIDRLSGELFETEEMSDRDLEREAG